MNARLLSAFLAGLLAAGIAFSATLTRYGNDYARDRAEIDDLMARYLFALDWQDPELYASLFTEDGTLVWAGGTATGRAAITADMRNARAADHRMREGQSPQRPFRRRHFVSNVVLRIDGERATSRGYWWEFNNDALDRRPYLGAYGHYEDELRRVDGRWLFSRRRIYNEMREAMAAGDANPAW